MARYWEHEELVLSPWEVEAIDAWVEDALPRGLEQGFASRVMARDAADRAEDAWAPRPRPKAPLVRAAAWRIVAALAVMAAIAMVVAPTRRAPETTAPHSGFALPSDRDHAPRLRSEGVPGRPFPETLERDIGSYIAGYGRHYGPAFRFHGAVVVARGGEIAFARGFGVARPTTGTPNGPGTRFRIGMLTEQFTAAAILRLHERGALDLDDPIRAYLPAFPHGESITLEHLLTHTSGIPNYTSAPEFHALKGRPHTTAAMVETIAALPLLFAPGTSSQPTNSGYFLLGAIIERVTGLTYAEFMRRELFEPAGMHATTVGDVYETGEQAYGNVWSDDEGLEPPEPLDLSVFGAAGGIVSSALDLVRWDAALREGDLLSAESLERMTTPNRYGYGYGVVLSRGYGQPVASFPGVIDGFNGAMIRFLGDGTLVVVLSNNEVVPAMRMAQDIAAIAYGDRPPPRVEHREIRVAPGTFGRFTGRYRLSEESRARFEGVADPEGLGQVAEVAVERHAERLYLRVPGHGVSWMHPMGDDRFFFKDHAGTTARFELGPDGRAVRLVLDRPEGELVLNRP